MDGVNDAVMVTRLTIRLRQLIPDILPEGPPVEAARPRLPPSQGGGHSLGFFNIKFDSPSRAAFEAGVRSMRNTLGIHPLASVQTMTEAEDCFTIMLDKAWRPSELVLQLATLASVTAVASHQSG